MATDSHHPTGKLVVLAVIVALIGGGYLLYRHVAGAGDIDIVWTKLHGRVLLLTVVFKRAASGDLSDVRLRLESEALTNPVELKWRDLRRGPAPGVGKKTQLRVPLREHLKPGFRLIDRELKATFYWNGKKQDSGRDTWRKDPPPVTKKELQKLVPKPVPYR
jgi:hypothetical protein